MKKSKLVTIGLLALSIASCKQREKRHMSEKDWEDYNKNPQAYVSTDGGNHYGVGNNIWFWMYIMNAGGGGYRYAPSAAYVSRTYYYHGSSGFSSNASRASSSRVVSSSGGRSVSVSRGGFGFSGSHVSA